MGQEINEATRIMGAPGAPTEDRTMVAGGPPSSGATQMGVTVVCAICKTSNPGLETYCVECGFLLSSTPGAAEPVPAEEEAALELVEASSGRRFRLRPGVNTVGRENCDILLMDGTVSRRHAQFTVENGAVVVTDLGSTNGTQVDNSRITPNQPTPLAPGATLRFGNALLTLMAPGGAETTIVAGTPPPPAADQTLVATPPAAPPPPAPTDAAEVMPFAGETPAAPPLILEEAPAPSAAQEPAVARLKPTAANVPEIRIRPGTLTIGRRPGNDVILPHDPYISGRHAEILCDNTGCYLTDAGSTNGTVVNGTRLEPGQKQLLLDGDEISIGQSGYLFETLELPEETEPESSSATPPLERGEEPGAEASESATSA